ncbi:MAG: recombinase family protein [Bacilli bacterium]|nr:recombinase family protein [Bacilli bacterium]
MEKTITKLDALPKLAKKPRVAAYARVSSGKDAMLHSLSTQVEHYKKMILENNEWEFAGVYADKALTGTKDSREEFQQLLADCRAGFVDTIITKSISRFARNTVTLLETVRELKSLGIDVFFEEQDIHSISGEGEMILTFLATFAQEESRSTSENMKWRIKKDFEQGIMWGGKSCLGYKLENKRYVLVPEEAKIVKTIYQLYLNGNGDEQICKLLNAMDIPPINGTKWHWSTIRNILTNYNYTGDLILQKTYQENHLTKKKRMNNGEYDQYLIKDDHEPIISKETYHKAQRIRKQRLNKIDSKPVIRKHAFSGMLKCGVCGRNYSHKSTPYNDIWKCSYALKRGVEACHSKQVPTKMLIEASNHILSRQGFDEDFFKSKVDFILVMPNRRFVFQMKDGTSEEYIWKEKSRSESWTSEMRDQARIKELNRLKGGVHHG